MAEGIGEILTPLPALPICHILIGKPEAGCPTHEAYQLYDRYGAEYHPDTDYLVEQLRKGNFKAFAARMYNVFEEVITLEDVMILRNKMIAGGALGSLMSGSGSAVFGVFESRSLAKHCMRKLYGTAQSVFLARPVNFGAVVIDAV